MHEAVTAFEAVTHASKISRPVQSTRKCLAVTFICGLLSMLSMFSITLRGIYGITHQTVDQYQRETATVDLGVTNPDNSDVAGV